MAKKPTELQAGRDMRDTTSMEDSRQSRRRQEPTVVAKEKEGGAAASEDEEEELSSDGEFEFPSVSRDSSFTADELFAAAGRVHAFYPVFGRVLDEEAPAPRAAPLGRLFQLEQARTSSVASTSSSSSSSSSASTADAAGLDSASPDSYCLWAPGSSPASSPARPPRKSGSTGSVQRWRRIGDLVAGRSRSDGKDRFLFLSAPPSPARDDKAKPQTPPQPPKGKGSSKAPAAATELDAVAAGRRMSGGYGGANNSKASNGGRRTFLPYRQDLVGLFATVHGLSRSPHPF